MNLLFKAFIVFVSTTGLTPTNRISISQNEGFLEISWATQDENTKLNLVVLETGEHSYRKFLSQNSTISINLAKFNITALTGTEHVSIVAIDQNFTRSESTHTTFYNEEVPEMDSFDQSRKIEVPGRLYASDIRHNQFSVNWDAVSEAKSYYVKLYYQGQYQDSLMNSHIRNYNLKTNYFSPIELKEATYYKAEVYVIDANNQISFQKTIKSEIKTLGVAPIVVGCKEFLCDITEENRVLLDKNVDEPSCTDLSSNFCWDDLKFRKFIKSALRFFDIKLSFTTRENPLRDKIANVFSYMKKYVYR